MVDTSRSNAQANQAAQKGLDIYQARDFFVYELDFLALANGVSATQTINIQQEADFLLTKMAQQTDLAAAAITSANQPIPLCTIMISDTGSGRQLMNTAVPLHNLFGEGDLPFILPRQRIFIASSVINVTLSNYSAATTYNVRLSLIGEKGFRY